MGGGALARLPSDSFSCFLGAYARLRRMSELTDKLRCAECGREVDEFTAIAEKWRYWSDGVGELVPICPECARREFASDARASGSIALSLGVVAPGGPRRTPLASSRPRWSARAFHTPVEDRLRPRHSRIWNTDGE